MESPPHPTGLTECQSSSCGAAPAGLAEMYTPKLPRILHLSHCEKLFIGECVAGGTLRQNQTRAALEEGPAAGFAGHLALQDTGRCYSSSTYYKMGTTVKPSALQGPGEIICMQGPAKGAHGNQGGKPLLPMSLQCLLLKV